MFYKNKVILRCKKTINDVNKSYNYNVIIKGDRTTDLLMIIYALNSLANEYGLTTEQIMRALKSIDKVNKNKKKEKIKNDN